MRGLLIHLSALIGVLIFLNQLSRDAALEQTVFMAVGAGFAIYLVLLIASASVYRILHPKPPPPADEKDPAAPAQRSHAAPEAGTQDRPAPTKAPEA